MVLYNLRRIIIFPMSNDYGIMLGENQTLIFKNCIFLKKRYTYILIFRSTLIIKND